MTRRRCGNATHTIIRSSTDQETAPQDLQKKRHGCGIRRLAGCRGFFEHVEGEENRAMSLPGVSSLRRAVEVVVVMLVSGAVGNSVIHRMYAPDLSVPPPVNLEADVKRFKAEDAARAAAQQADQEKKASAQAQ
jgi:hypothetical protein